MDGTRSPQGCAMRTFSPVIIQPKFRLECEQRKKIWRRPLHFCWHLRLFDVCTTNVQDFWTFRRAVVLGREVNFSSQNNPPNCAIMNRNASLVARREKWTLLTFYSKVSCLTFGHVCERNVTEPEKGCGQDLCQWRSNYSQNVKEKKSGRHKVAPFPKERLEEWGYSNNRVLLVLLAVRLQHGGKIN